MPRRSLLLRVPPSAAWVTLYSGVTGSGWASQRYVDRPRPPSATRAPATAPAQLPRPGQFPASSLVGCRLCTVMNSGSVSRSAGTFTAARGTARMRLPAATAGKPQRSRWRRPAIRTAPLLAVDFLLSHIGSRPDPFSGATVLIRPWESGSGGPGRTFCPGGERVARRRFLSCGDFTVDEQILDIVHRTAAEMMAAKGLEVAEHGSAPSQRARTGSSTDTASPQSIRSIPAHPRGEVRDHTRGRGPQRRGTLLGNCAGQTHRRNARNCPSWLNESITLYATQRRHSRWTTGCADSSLTEGRTLRLGSREAYSYQKGAQMKTVINDYISHQNAKNPAPLSSSNEPSRPDGTAERGATHG